MNVSIELLKKSRAFALRLVEGLSEEMLNTIPKGFSNNIIWNLAHLVAAEQGILYLRSNALPPCKPWTTPYGIELTSIDTALEFLVFHEGLHCGYIMALKRAVAAEQAA